MHPNIDDLAPKYGIDYKPEREPALGFRTTWVQEAKNHQAIFDFFYQDIVPDQSLCIAYAKQVPFVEDNRRVVIGIGHVLRIVPAIEHKHTDAGNLRSMIWETMICHSIREDHKDGFIIPYQDIHPNLVTIPLQTGFSMPYGLIYAKEPTTATVKFIKAVSSLLE